MTKMKGFKKGQNKGFRFFSKRDGIPVPDEKRKQVFVHHYKLESEDLRDVRIAEAALEEYRRDPSTAISWEEAKKILRAEGLIAKE